MIRTSGWLHQMCLMFIKTKSKIYPMRGPIICAKVVMYIVLKQIINSVLDNNNNNNNFNNIWFKFKTFFI